MRRDGLVLVVLIVAAIVVACGGTPLAPPPPPPRDCGDLILQAWRNDSIIGTYVIKIPCPLPERRP